MKRKEALVACPERDHEEEVAPKKKTKRSPQESVANSKIVNTDGAIVQGEAKVAKKSRAGGSILTDRAFSDLPLSQPTLKALDEMGFKTMTEVFLSVSVCVHLCCHFLNIINILITENRRFYSFPILNCPMASSVI
jgi:hypothetical protein